MKVLILRRPLLQGNKQSGLSTQLEKTVAGLRALGVETHLTSDADCDLSDYDLLHIFTVPDAHRGFRGWLNAQRHHKPVVVTPIYWNLNRFETEGRALIGQWGPELVDRSETGKADRSLRQEIEELSRQATDLTLCLVYRGAHLLMPLSQVEAEQLVRDFQVEPARLRIIYNAVDPRFGQASAEPFTARYGLRDFVICAARIDPRKNQYSLLRALEHEKIPLVLIGSASSPEYLAACQRLGRPHTLFLPPVGEAEIAEAYASAKVHVLVTWGEVASLAALEAGLAGCNLVMTEDSSAREYFGEHAWYCDPGDLASIRRAVLDALSASRGQAREFIRTNYTWERATQQTCEAYNEAMSCQPPQYDMRPDLERLAQVQAELIPLQEQYSGLVWREKTVSQERERGLANGRIMRWLSKLGVPRGHV